MSGDEVLVVGGGVAGAACARALHDGGVPVLLRDRGHRLGGRMAVRTFSGRPVDVGASYFTVSSALFADVVRTWESDRLARPWTDTFHVGTPEGLVGPKAGPLRYATPLGLRSLVESLAVRLAASHPDEAESVGPGPVCDGVDHAAVVLAMPGPQALDLLSDELPAEREASDRAWEPCLSLVTHWDRRCWPDVDGVFVHDSPFLTWIADDGRRRGDDAPVLVAHSTAVLAAEHLDRPDGALPAMLAEQSAVLGITAEPLDVTVKRWSLAKPAAPHAEPFHLGEARVVLCGDGWHGPSRIESAYLSGHLAGRALLQLLGP